VREERDAAAVGARRQQAEVALDELVEERHIADVMARACMSSSAANGR
jgi:hypothetical protein